MEPDILATPGTAVFPGWNGSSVETNGHAVDAPMSSVMAPPHEAPAARPIAPPRHAPNGHANGAALLPLNGSRNGSSHAAGATNGHAAETTGGPYQRVRTAGPVNIDEVLAALDARSHSSLYLRFGKRLVDIGSASVALLLSMPVLIAAAIAISLESRGPLFYRSVRIGRNGRPFTFLKLRSMVQGADRHRHQLTHLNECDGPVFKSSRDPRITRVGRFLRTTSIDEIPQFVNVLRGEMSMVGPRPPIPEEVAQYEPWQLRRLDVRPGITCLWQISGRSRIGFQEWMRLDLEYIKHQSFWLDVKILLRTIPAVLSREGAY